MATEDAARRFEQALPFYVNGTLPAQERLFVEQYLREHPDARDEALVWAELGASLARDACEIPADIGLARLEQRMRASANQRERSLLDKVVDWLRPLATPRAFALAGVLLLVQTGAIIALLARAPAIDVDEAEMARTRSLGKPIGPSVVVEVQFASQSSLQDVTQLLSKLGASVIAGPNHDERYELKVPREAANSVIETLSRSGTVVDAKVLPVSTKH